MKILFIDYDTYLDTYQLEVTNGLEVTTRHIDASELPNSYDTSSSDANKDIEPLLIAAYDVYSQQDTDDPSVMIGITITD